MPKDKQTDGIARMAAEIGSKTALEAYAKEKQREKKQRADRRLYDTKRLMRNYREIKIHAEDAIEALGDIQNEDFDFYRSLMEEDDRVDVMAIIQSKARSAIMLAHIEAMLDSYQKICYASQHPEEMRRYRVMEAMCISELQEPVTEIAERENIDVRTVYRDLDAACDKMSALLFGIQWIERE